tara:strand:- start:84 stop:218 length:135 start_codon:yes stop_codon:yes gene_type:complete
LEKEADLVDLMLVVQMVLVLELLTPEVAVVVPPQELLVVPVDLE